MSSSLNTRRLGATNTSQTHSCRRADRRQARTARRGRQLGLEVLEHRELLSVSSPIQFSSDLGGDVALLGEANVRETVALVENSPPVAVDDAFSIMGDQQLGAGILANDSDPDGDPLSVALENDAAHGTLSLAAGGLFTYMPNEGFTGTDSFTYFASDGQADSNPATVTIAVGAVNHAPQAENDGYATELDQPLAVAAESGVLANDTDADGDPLATVLVAGPDHGTLTLAADGSFEFTPHADFRGQDSFTYRASDGQGASNLASVSIAVGQTNQAPLAVDDSYSINEDESLSVTAAGILSNDGDAEGDQLTAALQSAPSHGVLTLGLDGSFEYTPAENFHGEDSFTYLANDGQADGNLATVSITVEPVNDLPVSTDDAYSIGEDATLIVEAAGVLANDTDVEGDPLSAVLVDAPANGTLTLAADGSFEYTPALDFHGEDSFTYLANDGTADGNLATVSITVEPVNDLPISTDDAYSIGEDATLIVEAAGVLANDTDVDGDSLSAVLVDAPANGTLTLAADGSFEYAPAQDFHGEDSFTYLANDGTADGNLATVSVTVEPVNDLPVSRDDAYSIGEDATLIVEAAGVLGNDTDVEGDPLSAVLVDAPANGTLTLAADGSFEYAPALDFHGEDSFTYLANDGQADGNLATVGITVESVNDLPVSANDAYSVGEDETLIVEAAGVLGNDIDMESDPLSAVLVDAPANGTLNLAADGSFEYTPAENFHGQDSFTYLANDGQADGNLATVSITVESVNDSPVSTDDAYSIGEDETLIVEAAGVLANDTDVEGDPLSAVLVDAPANGTLTLAADGSFEYAPAPDFHGLDSFTYLANDGQADGTPATVTVLVEHLELAIKLDVSGTAFGLSTASTWAGSTFWVNAYVKDLRDLPQGVVGGAIDILFDSLLVTPTENVAYGEDFAAFRQGTPEALLGLIDETGALATTSGVGSDDFAPFVAWEFVAVGSEDGAIANRLLHFAADPGEGTDTITPAHFALAGSPAPVDWAFVDLGSVDHELHSGDFNGDDSINHFDLALWLAHSGSALGDLDYDSLYDLNADNRIDKLDVDLLMSTIYQPVLPPPSPILSDAGAESEFSSGVEGPQNSLADAANAVGVTEGVGQTDELAALEALFDTDPLWSV